MQGSINPIRIVVYILGILLVVVSVPAGNALHDRGIIHTCGIVLSMFLGVGLYWDFLRKK